MCRRRPRVVVVPGRCPSWTRALALGGAGLSKVGGYEPEDGSAGRQPEHFATWLAEAMRRRGLFSNRDLSRATGLSDSVISRWRTADVAPSVPQLRRLSGALQTDLLELCVHAGILSAQERHASLETTGSAVTSTPVQLDTHFERLVAAAEFDEDLRRVVVTAWRSAQRLQRMRRRPESIVGSEP